MCHTTANGCLELPPPAEQSCFSKAQRSWLNAKEGGWKSADPGFLARNTPGACRDAPGVIGTSALGHWGSAVGLCLLSTLPHTFVT